MCTLVRNGMPPALSVNKDVTVISVAAITEGELVSPEGTREGKNTCRPSAVRLQLPSMVSLEDAQEVDTQDSDFPGGPVVRTSPSKRGGGGWGGFQLWSGS